MINVILYTIAGVALAAPAGLVVLDMLRHARPARLTQPPRNAPQARLTALGPDAGYVTIPGASP